MEEFSFVSRRTLHSLLQQFIAEGWSGTLALESEGHLKTLELYHGEIAFAGSSLLDDRLGEVLYRQGLISLDKLRHYGTLVTPENKFGQVLLNLHSFSQEQLWEALCLQVRQIVKSLFYAPSCYLEIYPHQFQQTNMVSLDGSNAQFVAACFAFGSLLEIYQGRFTKDTKIRVSSPLAEALATSGEDTTFKDEFLRILKTNPLVLEVSKHLKLPASYSFATILDFWHKQYLSIEGLGSREPSPNPELVPLKQQIQAYNLLLQTAEHHGGLEKNPLPLEGLRTICGTWEQPGLSFRWLSPSGQIDSEAAVNLYCLAEASRATLPAMLKAVKKLQCYVLQVTYDVLSPVAYGKVREIFELYSHR
jgi:hypothetical protein